MPDFPMNTEDFVEVLLAATADGRGDDAAWPRGRVRGWCALIVVDKPAADRAFRDVPPSLQHGLIRAVEEELDQGARVLGIA